MAKVTGEAAVSGCGNLGNEVQVVSGGDDRDVTEIHRQLRKLGLHVDAGPIPAQECLHGKGMAQVMSAWIAPVGVAHLGIAKEPVQAVPDGARHIGPKVCRSVLVA